MGLQYSFIKKYSQYSSMILHLICIIFIIILSNTATLYSILPLSWDECGYMGQAKLLAGDNWSNVISQMPYYSYGCGIVPSLIMRIGLPYYIEYRIILFINSLLLIGIYCISINLIKSLYSGISDKLASIISFVVVCYPSNIAFSNFLLSENYLTFFLYVVCLLLVKYLNTEKNGYLLGSFGIAAFMFYIHNRAIALIVALIILFICIITEKKQWRNLILLFGLLIVTAIILWVGNKYKIVTQNSLWPVKNNLSAINDIGQIAPSEMIRDLLDVKKLGLRLTMASGKIWYLLVATFGLFAIGIFNLAKKSLTIVKGRFTIQKGFALFLFLSFIGTCGVFFLLNAGVSRIDHIIIGRYLDYMVGPIIMIGLCEMQVDDSALIKRILLISAIAIMIVGKLIEKTAYLNTMNGISIFDRLSNAEWVFMWEDNYTLGTFMAISVISGVVVLLIISLLSISRKTIIFICLLFNVINAISYNCMIIKGQKENNYSLVDIAKVVEDNDIIGFVPVDTGAIKIQYILSNTRIHPIYDVEEMNPEDYDYIFSSRPILINIILDNYDIVYETESGYLYRNAVTKCE